MKKWFIFGVLAIAFILSIEICSASVTVSENTSYINSNSAAGVINGMINLSVKNENALSILSTNMNGTITLADFVKANGLKEGVDFNCSIRGCNENYETISEVSTVNMDSLNPPVIGFKVNGNDVSGIRSIKLKVSSSAQPTCRISLFADILNQKENFIVSAKATGEVCSGDYNGCFNKTLTADSYDITELTNQQYCEKIQLPPSPGFELGANVKNSTIRQSDLTMSLYEITPNGPVYIDECKLPKNKQSNIFEELQCKIGYSNSKTKDYLVCISSESDLSGYKINSETQGALCGSLIDSPADYTRDYDVFAKTLKFATPEIEINDSTFYGFNGIDITDYANSYLTKIYGGNCSKGCVIPIGFIGDSQTLTFSDAEVAYDVKGVPITTNHIYSVRKVEPTINFGYKLLDISKAGFKILASSSADTIKLYFGSNNIFEQQITSVSSNGFTLIPRSALIGINTQFEAESSMNVTSSSWNFGDGTTVSSSTNKASHKYLSSGEYTVSVTLQNASTSTSGTFVVSVGNPGESAARLIGGYQTRISNISTKLNSFSGAVLSELKKQINITLLNQSLENLRLQYLNATTDAEYSQIISDIFALNIPYDIAKSEISTVPISAGYGNIDSELITKVTNEPVESAQLDALKNAIAGWLNSNYAATINQEVTSLFTDAGRVDVVTSFKITITKKDSAENGYLIIGLSKDSINFAESYSATSAGDSGTAIPISESKTISFTIPQKVEVSDLGAYIAPTNITKFSLGGGEITPVTSSFPWTVVITVLVILILAAVAAYFIIMRWYKLHYESKLFKNPENLLNIMKFIESSRKTGTKDKDIKKKLKNAGWTGEQISYGFNKVDKKEKTEKKVVTTENQQPTMGRFIKQP